MANPRCVMGIDAAWTLTQPSGVALVAGQHRQWRLVAVAASYQRFLALADSSLQPETRPLGSRPDVAALLAAAERLSNCSLDLVAVDMPLARSQIEGRRSSDNAVSRAYGGRSAGTHSPSSTRPGLVSNAFTKEFSIAGFPLLTSDISCPGLIEVYPHPALIELTSAPKRLPYKISRAGKYWKGLPLAQRRINLCSEWEKIVTALNEEIDGVAAAFPAIEPSTSGALLKAYEDMLDAVVCAWVGICAIEGRAMPFGDNDSAIWIPKPLTATASGEASGSRE
ncbi:conserved hypothetical protein [Parvibaculum lavamentivorans DS-1]|uniref:DUF429 domain-containing protein n=1 Tax=Parvibaculum lavamentivorans (strain DS-1 / DSM 13023 / NCIMB 13966) TaxID=402881 RepID=A7HX12_PARL1|nr:DUF429 domain-containing protein [Parvibaculum lavamentivorans]ABS64445.1 conserved hypothetical protein [Parvibaculum lavamentivorans DS-1]